MDTTKLGTDEQDRLTLRPSASKTSLFPLGQMIWSTWVRTFSQVKSWVFKAITSISVLEWPMLHTMQPFFILSMWSRVTTDLLPEAVMTMSTLLITASNFTTCKYRENSDIDCAFMAVSIENHKVPLASITLWFSSKERHL